MIKKESKTKKLLESTLQNRHKTIGNKGREIFTNRRLVILGKKRMPLEAERKATIITRRLIEEFTDKTFAIGIGYQATHWGEICQGPVDFYGRTITALITLPRCDLWTVAAFQPYIGSDVIVEPAYANKSAQAIRLVLDSYGFDHMGGKLILECNITKVGCGAGSSTCNVVAAVRSVDAALNLRLSDVQIQKITQYIEGASDPLAITDDGSVVIYGSRTGQIISYLKQSLPPLVCLGFVTEPSKVVLTEQLIATEEFTRKEVSDFAKILQLANLAIESRRSDLLAKAATESAYLNQKQVPIKNYNEILQAAIDCGACGVSVSHSGTVGAALFDPLEKHLNEKIKTIAEVLCHLGCVNVKQFKVTAA